MNEKTFPSLDRWSDIPDWITAKTDEERDKIVGETNSCGAQEFSTAHPDYYASDFNFSILSARLQGMPLTSWNLGVAYDDLREAGLLEIAPQTVTPEVDTSHGITQELQGIAEYRPGNDERKSLEKVHDDVNLSDVQRKKRDRALAELARKQRQAGVMKFSQ